jgi:hypothetical protein
MLVRRHTYESVGGHCAVRGAICEDVELARVIKKAGAAVLLQDGRSLLSARMYDGWRSLLRHHPHVVRAVRRRFARGFKQTAVRASAGVSSILSERG